MALLALLVSAAALTPTPLPRAPAALSAPAALLRTSAAALAASAPAAAFADGGAGINGAFKAAVAEALPPGVADAAPIIGTVIFVGIFAVQTGVGGSNDKPAAGPPSE